MNHSPETIAHVLDDIHGTNEYTAQLYGGQTPASSPVNPYIEFYGQAPPDPKLATQRGCFGYAGSHRLHNPRAPGSYESSPKHAIELGYHTQFDAPRAPETPKLYDPEKRPPSEGCSDDDTEEYDPENDYYEPDPHDDPPNNDPAIVELQQQLEEAEKIIERLRQQRNSENMNARRYLRERGEARQLAQRYRRERDEANEQLATMWKRCQDLEQQQHNNRRPNGRGRGRGRRPNAQGRNNNDFQVKYGP